MNNISEKCAVTIEGISLTPELIKTIKQWQEGYLQTDLNTIDDAISHIVSSVPEDIEASWDLIYRLTQLKGYLKTIKPKEE